MQGLQGTGSDVEALISDAAEGKLIDSGKGNLKTAVLEPPILAALVSYGQYH